jgi:hypothetical protein
MKSIVQQVKELREEIDESVNRTQEIIEEHIEHYLKYWKLPVLNTQIFPEESLNRVELPQFWDAFLSKYVAGYISFDQIKFFMDIMTIMKRYVYNALERGVYNKDWNIYMASIVDDLNRYKRIKDYDEFCDDFLRCLIKSIGNKEYRLYPEMIDKIVNTILKSSDFKFYGHVWYLFDDKNIADLIEKVKRRIKEQEEIDEDNCCDCSCHH